MNVTPDISIGQILTLGVTLAGFALTIAAGWFAMKAQTNATADKLQALISSTSERIDTLTKSTTRDLCELKSAVKESVDELGKRVGSVERDLQSLRLEIAKEYVSAGKLKEVKDELAGALGKLQSTVETAMKEAAIAVEAARKTRSRRRGAAAE